MLTETIVLVIVIYLRVSTEDQARKGYSLPEQREAAWNKARDLAAALEKSTGNPIDLQVHEFADDFGGDIVERPQLEEVRRFIRERRPRHFICLNPDRFSRSLELQLMITREILAVGCSLEYVEYDFNPDPEGMLQYQVRGAVSEFEKKQILKRTSRGKQRKLKEGGRPNGACPYGYVHNKATDELEIFEDEAKWVRQMYQWAAKEFMGARTISMKLNSLGVPTKRGNGRWSRSAVRRILSSTSYIGEMKCNRFDFRGLSAVRRLPRAKRGPLTPKKRPMTEWVSVPIPAIIDRALYDQVQANLQVLAKRGGRRDTGLLSMLAQCGVCGSGMHYARNPRGYNYLRCGRMYPYLMDFREGTPSCPNRNHRLEPVESHVWERLTEWLTEPDLLKEYLAVDTNHSQEAEKLDLIHREKELLEQQLTEKRNEQRIVIQQQARGRISDTDADAMLDEIQEQMQSLSTALENTVERMHALQVAVVTTTESVSLFGEVAAAMNAEAEAIRGQMDAMPPDQRRELILRLVQKVVVDQDGTIRIFPRSLL